MVGRHPLGDNQEGPICYAHSLSDQSRERWEPLYTGTGEGHLERVALLAGQFAEKFGAREWGTLAGLWHDLGKFSPEFQAYLKGKHARVEHSGLGAALARSRKSRFTIPLSFAIAGHHVGLANAQSNSVAEELGGGSLPTPLLERLQANEASLRRFESQIPLALRDLNVPDVPQLLLGRVSGDLDRALEFWTRILFSALVDADRLATAAFYNTLNPSITHEELEYDSLCTLSDRLDANLTKLSDPAGALSTPMNQLRAEVLAACRDAAEMPSGCFSMTVPTGGGKTLSAMSFALRHALRHNHGRVIVVIPYTSIIEQNAKIYRDALGSQNVLEHHSNLDESKLAEEDSECEVRRRLAAENWDAPVVVTTSVQFFESLLSNHPSRCRKLHNIARSTVILDEVQTLQPRFLETVLDVLRELTRSYSCSIVLSTATPPALVKRREDQHYGLENVTEIIRNASELANRARRVHVNWQVEESIPYDSLAQRLVYHQQVLAIVHRRRDARVLAQAVKQLQPRDEVYHLSALMCPAHRIRVLQQIKDALSPDTTCRVIATQLVEAGVDLDFHVVYRAVSGLDSLAQAAGRCDREGNLTAENGGKPGGELIVFRAPTEPPRGVLHRAMETTLALLRLRGDLDVFDPATCEDYFQKLYAKHDLDDRSIQRDRESFDFATVAAKFRMIDSATHPIVVPYDDAMERVEEFRRNPSRNTQRSLQPYLVQINPSQRAALETCGAIETLHDRVDVLTQPFWNRYDDVNFGLDPDADGVMDVEVLCDGPAE